jgi:hypothetical protein
MVELFCHHRVKTWGLTTLEQEGISVRTANASLSLGNSLETNPCR